MDIIGIPKFEYNFTVDRYSIYGLNRYRNFSTAAQDTQLTIENMRDMAADLLIEVDADNPALFVVGTDALYCYFIDGIDADAGEVLICEMHGEPNDLWFFKKVDGTYLFDRYTLLIQTDNNKYIIG